VILLEMMEDKQAPKSSR